jgi:hypothetical protein
METKETLAELIERKGYPRGATQEIWEDGVRLGAKWQQERMYSEEDVLDIFHEWFCYQIDEDVEIKLSFQKWFEQFKKK